MGVEQESIGHITLPTNGAIAQPNLFVNDCVLVRQMNEDEEFWAPGIVMVLPSPVAQPPLLYMIHIYTPSAQRVWILIARKRFRNYYLGSCPSSGFT
jgi:hypothetical protein